MTISRATVQTDQPGRYILRLSKHWGHKFAVTFDNERSHIDLGDSICELVADSNALHVVLHAPDELTDELQVVIAEHLQRFAPRETQLSFVWTQDNEQGNLKA
ncbi:DUF2218 domain-containing protein [Pseudomonas hunanensis]|uniref:DUF2218 domain-containing protein n=1 Tax=Pseudomonas hunanensis TaxID=1247546 RepID=A0ABD6N1X7_9PSED|nr:DUF2218 domain-containing protein [Pseudomonas hunanensis]NWL47394.1 DUF2218 domain-containing protein [Pseudomonas hunanensis]